MGKNHKPITYLIFFALVAVTLIAGIVGWYDTNLPGRAASLDFSDAVYMALLAFGGDDNYVTPSNWGIAVARYTGILASVFAIFAVLSALLQKRFITFRARNRRGHTVLLGATDFMINYAVEDARTRYRDDTIWRRIRRHALWLLRTRKITVIEGAQEVDQITTPGAFRSLLQISFAPEKILAQLDLLGKSPARIICGGADEMQNIELALIVARRYPDVVLVIGIYDETIAANLTRLHPILSRAEIISDAFVIARSLIVGFKPQTAASLRGQDRAHVVVVGFGSVGLAVAEQVALTCGDGAAPGDPDAVRPLLTVFDIDPVRADMILRRSRPGLASACDIQGPFQLDALECGVGVDLDQLCALEGPGKPGITAIVVCVGNDLVSMQIGMHLLSLQQSAERLRAPIFVRLTNSGSILPVTVNNLTRGLYAFGGTYFSDQDLMLQDIVREEAKVLYVHWRAHNVPGDPDWEDLPFEVKRSNFRAAGAAEQQLRHINLIPPKIGELAYLAAHPAVIERTLKNDTLMQQLYLAEHNRWSNERFAEGWQHSKVRNDARKLHDCLKDYKTLNVHKQRNDQRNVAALLEYSNRQGAALPSGSARMWRLRLRVGVMGMMQFQNADRDDAAKVVAGWIRELGPKADEYTLEVVTPNAPGTDRVLARIVLQEWHRATGRHAHLICDQVCATNHLDWLSLSHAQRKDDRARATAMAECDVQTQLLRDAAKAGQVLIERAPSGAYPSNWYDDPEPFYALCEEVAQDIAKGSDHVFAYLTPETGGSMSRRVVSALDQGKVTVIVATP